MIDFLSSSLSVCEIYLNKFICVEFECSLAFHLTLCRSYHRILFYIFIKYKLYCSARPECSCSVFGSDVHTLNGSYGRVEKSFQFCIVLLWPRTMAADRSTGVRIELLFCYVNFPFIILLCARACPAKTLCRVPVFLLTIIAYSTMCLGLLNHFHKENSISNFPLAQYRMYSSTSISLSFQSR